MKAAKGSVRFQNTPNVLGAQEEALMDALQFDETSSSLASSLRSGVNITEASFMSEGRVNRLNYVGRTPHAKVIENEQTRRKLEELTRTMNIPILPSPIQASPAPILAVAAHDSPQSDISYSPGEAHSPPLHIDELSTVAGGNSKNITPATAVSEKSSASDESSFNIFASVAEKIIDSMPNGSVPPARSAHHQDLSYSNAPANSGRAPLSSIENKPKVSAEWKSAEKEPFSKTVSLRAASESKHKPKTKAPVTPFVRTSSSSDDSQTAEESNGPYSPMLPASGQENTVEKQLFMGSSEKVHTSAAAVVDTAQSAREESLPLSLEPAPIDEPLVVEDEAGRKVEFIFLQAPKPDSREMATSYSPPIDRKLRTSELDGTMLFHQPPSIFAMRIQERQQEQSLIMDQELQCIAADSSVMLNGGVSFGKGPITLRKVESQGIVKVAEYGLERLVPRPLPAEVAELRPSKIARSPRNTRKFLPFHYPVVNKLAKSLVPIPEEGREDVGEEEEEFFEQESNTQSTPSLDALTSVYEEEALMFEPVAAAYRDDLYAIESAAVDVSIQVDSKMLASAKKGAVKRTKEQTSFAMQTSFSRYEAASYSTSQATTPQQSLYSNYTSFLTPASDNSQDQSSLDWSRSYALIDLLPKDGPTKKFSASNPWCSMPFDSTVCSAGGSASKSTVEMSNMYTTGFSNNSKTSSLGRAQRIPVSLSHGGDFSDTKEKEEGEDGEDDDKSISYQSLSVSSGKGSHHSIDVTLQTDVAVAQYSQDTLHEDDIASLRSALSGGNTTFTLDQSFMTKTTLSALENGARNREIVPRFEIKSLKRTPDYPFEVKEITFDTAPGEFTTVMMVFNNHREHPVTLHCNTVLVRLEPKLEDDQSWSMPPVAADFFTVTPPKLVIEGNGEGTLLVTFAPPTGMQGIFSGAMRIMQNHKSSIILLRGESSYGHTIQEALLPNFHRSMLPFSPALTSEREKNGLVDSPTPVTLCSTSSSSSPQPQQLQQHSPEKEGREGEVSELCSPASFKQLFSEIKASPTMAAYAGKLRALHTRIAEFGRRVAWNEQPDATPSTIASSVVEATTSNDRATLITPECVLIEQINDYCAINLENTSTRPVVVRLSTSDDCIRPCYPQGDSNLLCVSGCSTARLLVRMDAPQLLQKAVDGNGSVDCLCGSVVLQYNSGQDCRAEVAVLLSRTVVEALQVKAQQLLFARLDAEEKGGEKNEAENEEENDEEEEEVKGAIPSFHSTIRSSTSLNDLRSSRVSFKQAVSESPLMLQHHNTPFHTQVHPLGSSQRQSKKRSEEQPKFFRTTGPQGLFFEHQFVSFGAVHVGSDVKLKVRLCNATHHEMILYLGEPNQPFRIKHHQIAIRSKSCVRVPVCFSPTTEGEYQSELIVQSESGEEFAMAKLSGFAGL